MNTRDGYSTKVYETYNRDFYSDRNDLSAEGLRRAAKLYERSFGPYLPEDRSAKILEIGCGVGAFLDCLDSLGYRDGHGIDISTDQVEFCKSRGRENVELADALGFLQKTDTQFGVVVMSDVLEHLAKESVLVTLEAIADHLVPNGRLLLRVPNMSNPLNVRTRYVDFTHEVGFSQESLAQVLQLAGFDVVSIHGEFEEHRGLLARWIFDRLAWKVVQVLHRHTFHLKAEVVRGKNLIAVGTPRSRQSGPVR